MLSKNLFGESISLILVLLLLLFTFLCACSVESYAGIYVPTLVDAITNMNPRQTPDKQINFKGFAVTLAQVETT